MRVGTVALSIRLTRLKADLSQPTCRSVHSAKVWYCRGIKLTHESICLQGEKQFRYVFRHVFSVLVLG